jgi:hypothetical protein
MRKYISRGRIAAAVAGVLVVGTGGAAFAYFHTTGSGTGSVSTGTAVNVTISAATASNDLFPGRSGTVSFRLTNTNPFTANFKSVTAASVTSGNQNACPASNITVATLPYSISTISVAPGQTKSSQTITGLISMSSGAPSTCQGVSFTVSLTLAGQSS